MSSSDALGFQGLVGLLDQGMGKGAGGLHPVCRFSFSASFSQLHHPSPLLWPGLPSHFFLENKPSLCLQGLVKICLLLSSTWSQSLAFLPSCVLFCSSSFLCHGSTVLGGRGRKVPGAVSPEVRDYVFMTQCLSVLSFGASLTLGSEMQASYPE